MLVENAKLIANMKKHIKNTVSEFKGKKYWFQNNVDCYYETVAFTPETPIYSRFMTITFDPKKFSFNELSQPDMLMRYFKNALFEVRHLIVGKPVIVAEFMKSGVLHFHMNYQCDSLFDHQHFKMRMKFYFALNLRNEYCIHDRHFNDGGNIYIRKSNTKNPNKEYFTFKE